MKQIAVVAILFLGALSSCSSEPENLDAQKKETAMNMDFLFSPSFMDSMNIGEIVVRKDSVGNFEYTVTQKVTGSK